jgi:hypothetical protein
MKWELDKQGAEKRALAQKEPNSGEGVMAGSSPATT